MLGIRSRGARGQSRSRPDAARRLRCGARGRGARRERRRLALVQLGVDDGRRVESRGGRGRRSRSAGERLRPRAERGGRGASSPR